MEQLQVLTAVDEPAFGKELRDWLEDAGYGVIEALDPLHGLWELAVNQPGFVILDVPAQQREMFDLLSLIRERSPVPVILLSDEDVEEDKVEALSLGADDYMVKPVGRMELLARVGAILRRSEHGNTETGAIYVDSTITIDFAQHCVKVRGEEVLLTVLEYDILACLVKRVGQVVTQREIVDQVWGSEYQGCEYVKWHMSRLRRKIEDDPQNPELVATVRGVGYRYDASTNGGDG